MMVITLHGETTQEQKQQFREMIHDIGEELEIRQGLIIRCDSQPCNFAGDYQPTQYVHIGYEMHRVSRGTHIKIARKIKEHYADQVALVLMSPIGRF